MRQISACGENPDRRARLPGPLWQDFSDLGHGGLVQRPLAELHRTGQRFTDHVCPMGLVPPWDHTVHVTTSVKEQCHTYK